DDRGALPPNTDFVASLNNLADSTHGIEVATEFEPLEHDQPIQCPLHSPSHPFLMYDLYFICFFNFQENKRNGSSDGIIWKERVSASMRRRGELAIAQDGVDVESDGSVTKPSPTSQCNPNRRFSPSPSAPQPHMLNLLDECKASEAAIGEHRVASGALPPNTDFVASLNNLADSTHGIEVATEFEPLEHDQPIQCPLHSPSHPFLMYDLYFICFFNFQENKRNGSSDGIIWKERVSASMRRRGELAIAQDGVDVESDGSVTKPSPTSQCNPNRRFSPSLSAPQPHMLNLLDECKASGTI
ncbi:hypothetical protein HID58_059009, partial [Brassica napus]